MAWPAQKLGQLLERKLAQRKLTELRALLGYGQIDNCRGRAVLALPPGLERVAALHAALVGDDKKH